MLLFVLQKVAFVAVNHSFGGELCFGDWLAVVAHGLRLDCVITCYLMVVPILISMVASFFKSLNLRKIMTIWYLPLSLILTISFLADAVLYHYWGAKLDVADLVYAQNPKDMLASLSTIMLIMMVVVVVVLSVLQVLLFRSVTMRKTESIGRKWLSSVVFILLLAVDCVGMRGGFQESTANPSYAYFSKNQFLNHAALNPLFNIVHSMSKGEDLAHEFCFFDENDLEELTNDLFLSHDDVGDTLLTTTRPNILLLVWEGGGSLFALNDSVAPGFAELKNEGVFFSNVYANNFRTDRGLVSLLNGWVGLPTTSVMKMSGKCKSLPSLAKSLATQGYHSAFYYGGDIDFTNMRGYLYETGYEQVHGGDHYASAPVKSKWGVDDQYVLQSVVGDLSPQPFFATCLTLSSHEPWEVPFSRLKDEKANAFAYTDSCIYSMVRELKQMALWDNLLLIIVPDHGVAWSGHGPADVEVARIPMLWLGGAVAAPAVVDCLMNQSDIAATLLAQMQIQQNDFIFSRNVLSREYVPSVVTHAYKNGVNIIDSCGTSRYGIVEGEVVPTDCAVDNDRHTKAKAILQRVYQATSRL